MAGRPSAGGGAALAVLCLTPSAERLNHFDLNSVICRHSFAISRRIAPKFYWECPTLSNQRAQGMPGARCARSLVCSEKAHELVTTVTPESPGIPRAMVLTVSFVLSPVTGLVCHRRLQSCLRWT